MCYTWVCRDILCKLRTRFAHNVCYLEGFMTTSLRSFHVNGARFFLVFICCVMSSVGVSAQLPVDSSSGGFSWSDCKIPETELFERLNAIVQAVLHEGDRSHDTINAIDRALGRAWDAHRGDAVIRAAVEAASERILDEEGRIAVFSSGWSTEKQIAWSRLSQITQWIPAPCGSSWPY